MTYSSLHACVLDLEKSGRLVRVTEEVDPELEMAEIHRRVNQKQGPALFFEKVKGSPFPAVSNLYGTMDRCEFIFRKTLPGLIRLFRVKGNPALFLRRPWKFLDLPFLAARALPAYSHRAPVLQCQTTLSELPQIRSWPEDGGPYILLPQVYTEDPLRPGMRHSNLGMYRIQMAGNDYEKDREAGLHYQIRRDIGIHHTHARDCGQPLRVSVFVGGPPAHAFSAVMYLPEDLPEIAFAGVLAGRRFRYTHRDGFFISAEADFCITGWVDPKATKPEGPFGDHLGYYSLKHPFPFLKVESVTCRKNAIWPFTVVGRPPQEDSVLGRLIQEIAGPVLPSEIPGIKAVHAVDASGVHPLLLALGSERYAPFQDSRPRELLTLAHALLGYGPCALAKYLIIAAGEDDSGLDPHRVEAFLKHVLERIDWSRDLHFETRTHMDTLDYSGDELNSGSKVVMAATGRKRRLLSGKLPAGLKFCEGFGRPKVIMPGILAVEGPPFRNYESAVPEMKVLMKGLEAGEDPEGIALIVISDDSDFISRNVENFLWITFTRSNPSHDIYGVRSFEKFKHWGCHGPLVIDARSKVHHAPGLVEDAAVTKKVERLGKPGASLAGII